MPSFSVLLNILVVIILGVLYMVIWAPRSYMTTRWWSGDCDTQMQLFCWLYNRCFPLHKTRFVGSAWKFPPIGFQKLSNVLCPLDFTVISEFIICQQQCTPVKQLSHSQWVQLYASINLTVIVLCHNIAISICALANLRNWNATRIRRGLKTSAVSACCSQATKIA